MLIPRLAKLHDSSILVLAGVLFLFFIIPVCIHVYELTKDTFGLPKAINMFQAQNYDPEGEFVAYWLPQLRELPKERRHFPGLLYIKPVVALKFGNTKTTNNKTTGSGTRTTADENKWKGRKGNRTQ